MNLTQLTVAMSWTVKLHFHYAVRHGSGRNVYFSVSITMEPVTILVTLLVGVPSTQDRFHWGGATELQAADWSRT